MDTAWTWALGCALAALILFVLEIVIPSGGLLGTLSLFSLVATNVALFFVGTTAGWVGLLCSAVVVPIAIAVAVKVFPHTFIGRRLILADKQPADANVHYSSGQDDDYSSLAGQQGVVVSELRPVGTVRFGERRVECLSDRGIIETGATVQVVGVHGIEVKVRPVE